jgi:hypothetical protein
MKTNHFLSAGFFAGFLFVSLQLSAQEAFEIKGQVQNTKTESIKGAIVSLLNETTLSTVATAKCNEKGEFRIYYVAPGEYRLTIKKNGEFRAKTKTIVINENGEYYVQNIEHNKLNQQSELVAETNF